MFGKNAPKTKATAMLAAYIASAFMLLMPNDVQAQFADMLSDPSQGTRSLRDPLIPGAPYAAPGQGAYIGQAPPIGSGAVPAPVTPGDLGGPNLPPSGFADPTHGNIFPAAPGGGPKGPWEYVPGAGRYNTQNGIQQGVFENGQENYGTRWGSGGKNGGTDWGPGGKNGGSEWGPGGKNGGTDWGPGGKNGGTDWGPGGKNGGSEWGPGGKNGGTGMGPGGKNGGSEWGPGGKNGGTEWGSGGKNGGTAWGPGGKNGGSDIVNNGGSAAGAQGSGPGGKNGGSTYFEGGAENGGTRTTNNGGNAGGVGTVNNGGPRGDANKEGDTNNQHQVQPSRYDFQGPLPTVRTFSRYLVILGVVAATVFMCMAAWGMVMGSPYAGSRAIGAAAGLLLLLAGYTIWKIVQMNTFHANSTGWWSTYRNGQLQPMNNRVGFAPGSPWSPPSNPNNPNGTNAGGGNLGGGNTGGGNAAGGNNGTVGGMLGGGGNTNAGGIPGGGSNGGGGNFGGNQNGPIPNPPGGGPGTTVGDLLNQGG